MSDEQEQPVVVNDRRRIDPETGQLREAEPGELADENAESVGRHAAEEPVADPAAELKAQLDERTADLQRLQAEYANYRKRVERDREVNALAAKGQIVNELLGVLDDVERAAAHGDPRVNRASLVFVARCARCDDIDTRHSAAVRHRHLDGVLGSRRAQIARKRMPQRIGHRLP